MMKQGLLIRMMMFLTACSSTPSENIGVNNGMLKPCPDSPNCVSSLSDKEGHQIEPLHYDGPQQQAREKLLQVLANYTRTKVVESRDDYIHAECRSLILRFVDDLEFYFPTNETVIHVRSASRVGYSDWGVNRKRIEEIRGLFVGD